MQFVNEKDITVEKFKEAPEVLQTKENEETKETNNDNLSEM